MYLSDKKAGNTRAPSDHDELEVLLESFSKQVEEIVSEAENIQVWHYLYHISLASVLNLPLRACDQSNVQSTQEIVELILDSNRNALLALDLKVRFY